MVNCSKESWKSCYFWNKRCSFKEKKKKKANPATFYRKEVIQQLKEEAFAKQKEAEEKEAEKKESKKGKKSGDSETKEKDAPAQEVETKTENKKEKPKKEDKDKGAKENKDKSKSADEKKEKVSEGEKKNQSNGQPTESNGQPKKVPKKGGNSNTQSEGEKPKRKQNFTPAPVNVVINDFTSTPFIEADMDELLNSITASSKN